MIKEFAVRGVGCAGLALAAWGCTSVRAYPDVTAAEVGLGDTQAGETVLSADAAGEVDAAKPVADAGQVTAVDALADAATASDAGQDATATADVAQPDAAAEDTAAAEVAEDAVAADVAEDAGQPEDVADAIAVPDTAVVDQTSTMDMPAMPDMAGVDVPGGATNVDLIGVAWTCQDQSWKAPACGAGVTTDPPLQAGLHVDLPTPITYTDSPPASGTHRPNWAKWGEYGFLPKQRWLHNLEHGGVAFLYNPCTAKATVDAWRALAKAVPVDDGGPFRWVLTPYPDLPSAIAVVAWGHVYSAQCVQPTEVDAFLKAHYRKAPEDFGAPGDYDVFWMGQ